MGGGRSGVTGCYVGGVSLLLSLCGLTYCSFLLLQFCVSGAGAGMLLFTVAQFFRGSEQLGLWGRASSIDYPPIVLLHLLCDVCCWRCTTCTQTTFRHLCTPCNTSTHVNGCITPRMYRPALSPTHPSFAAAYK